MNSNFILFFLGKREFWKKINVFGSCLFKNSFTLADFVGWVASLERLQIDWAALLDRGSNSKSATAPKAAALAAAASAAAVAVVV